jgi:Domain of unknown function (DUF5666)
MKRQILKITMLSLFAAAIVAAPALLRAQDAGTNAPAASTPKHRHGAPFHGVVSALDANAMTLTVGKLTVQVTSETKITKDGKPATLADGAVGEPVSGYYKKDADGKLNAATIHFGGKKKAASDAGSSTGSVSK